MAENIKIAYVFPGQGSQKVGMGKDLYDNASSAKAIFEEADKVLEFPLSKLCFEGPEEELKLTKNAQPALVTMSFACLNAAQDSVVKSQIPAPSYVAGHSLGEYTALAYAGVLDFATTVYLAKERGRLMFEAGLKVPGSMAAVLNMEEDALKEICKESGSVIANINSPGQLVISGAKESVEKAVALASAKGARAMMLPVSGAFHSPLMKPVELAMSSIIDKLSFMNPTVPIVANTSGEILTTAASVKEELIKQICSSVQWQRSIEYMANNGTTTFIEIGSGKVLSGLIKRINKNVKTLNVSEMADLKNILAQ